MNAKKKTALLALGLLLAFGLLSACNLQRQEGSNQADQPGLVYTAAAQTVAAQLTLAAAGTPIVPATQTPVVLQPTATQPAPPTATNIPTNTAVPSTQVPPTATEIPVPCDRASFVKDVTYPDDTEVAAGSTFVKKWQLKNNGTCTWNSAYSLVFVNGDSMGVTPSQQLTTGVVAPGETLEVSVTLTAPSAVKTYKGNFMLRNPSGISFGIGVDARSSFWVQVKVVTSNTPTPTLTPTPSGVLQYDFINRGPNAEWRTGAGIIPWGDPEGDSVGMGFAVDNRLLEDGRTYNRALIMLPQNADGGYVRALFNPTYTVVANDRFRATIGIAAKCSNVKWRYQLKYVEGTTETLLGEWLESCDGKLTYIDKDLSSLVGKTVSFVFVVSREPGNLSPDLPYWLSPRIER